MPFDWLKSLRSPSRRNNSWGSITPLEPRTLLSATPIGPEFQVNTWTSNSQTTSAVAIDDDGDYVLAWRSYGQDGSGWGIFAQRYSSTGAAVGDEFQVNAYTTGNQWDPTIAMDADGDFVITWISDGQDGDGGGIYAQRFNAIGVPQGEEFRANSVTTNLQLFPSIAMDANGAFVIAWESGSADPNLNGVFAQRYDSSGTPQGGNVRVNTYTTGPKGLASIAMDSDGDFVISWVSGSQEGSGYGIYAQRYDSSSTPQGNEFRVNSVIADHQVNPSIAMDRDGDFTIAWQSYSQDGSEHGIYAQRYNSSGVPQGIEFRVNSYTTNFQANPDVAVEEDGDFTIAWISKNQDGSDWGIFAQKYSALGAPQGTEFQVNSYTISEQREPSIAMDIDGDFIISWNSSGQDGSDWGIIAQRYRSPHPDQLASWRSGKFYLDSNHSKTWNGSTTDTLNTFGSTTDKPIAGDWNGDAYADIAVWRNGTFYIDANGNGTWDGAATDKSFKFGLNTDTPIVGDWNGDGQDDIGVWRNGKFYLDLDGNRIWNSAIDKAFTFGAASDTPLIGDWNADGIDDLGVWRNGKFYLDLNANRAWNSGVDGIFTFGLNTDTPLIGDWNADGTDDIAVWRNGKFYQDSNGNRAWNSATDTLTTFGTTTDTPLIGYWRPKTIPGTPPNATPAPSPTPAAPLSIQVTPTAVTPFDFSGRWNYTGDIVNGYIIVNQIGKKASTLLRIGDLEFDMQAKIKGDRLTGKFSKNLPDTKIRGKFEATRINSTTFSGLLTISTNNNPAELPILGTRV